MVTINPSTVARSQRVRRVLQADEQQQAQADNTQQNSIDRAAGQVEQSSPVQNGQAPALVGVARETRPASDGNQNDSDNAQQQTQQADAGQAQPLEDQQLPGSQTLQEPSEDAQDSVADGEKIFTQADMDAAIKNRVRRLQAQQALALDDQKTQLEAAFDQQHQDLINQLASYEQQIAELQKISLCQELSLETGLPVEVIASLNATDEVGLRSQIDAIKALQPGQGGRVLPVRTEGTLPASGASTSGPVSSRVRDLINTRTR